MFREGYLIGKVFLLFITFTTFVHNLFVAIIVGTYTHKMLWMYVTLAATDYWQLNEHVFEFDDWSTGNLSKCELVYAFLTVCLCDFDKMSKKAALISGKYFSLLPFYCAVKMFCLRSVQLGGGQSTQLQMFHIQVALDVRNEFPIWISERRNHSHVKSLKLLSIV